MIIILWIEFIIIILLIIIIDYWLSFVVNVLFITRRAETRIRISYAGTTPTYKRTL